MQCSGPPVYWLCDHLSWSINVMWANVLNTDLDCCKVCNCSFLLTHAAPAGTLLQCHYSRSCMFGADIHRNHEFALNVTISSLHNSGFCFVFSKFFRWPVTQSLCPSLWPSSSLLSPSTACPTGISSPCSLILKISVPPSAAFTSLFLSRPLTNKVSGETWQHRDLHASKRLGRCCGGGVAGGCYNMRSILLVFFSDPWKKLHLIFKSRLCLLLNILLRDVKIVTLLRSFNG